MPTCRQRSRSSRPSSLARRNGVPWVYGRAEVGVPRVQVGVEVQHRDRAVVAGQRPQQRQRDGVVAADGQQFGPVGANVVRRRLDLRDGLAEVEGVDGDVAGIGDLVRPKGSTSSAGL